MLDEPPFLQQAVLGGIRPARAAAAAALLLPTARCWRSGAGSSRLRSCDTTFSSRRRSSSDTTALVISSSSRARSRALRSWSSLSRTRGFRRPLVERRRHHFGQRVQSGAALRAGTGLPPPAAVLRGRPHRSRRAVPSRGLELRRRSSTASRRTPASGRRCRRSARDASVMSGNWNAGGSRAAICWSSSATPSCSSSSRRAVWCSAVSSFTRSPRSYSAPLRAVALVGDLLPQPLERLHLRDVLERQRDDVRGPLHQAVVVRRHRIGGLPDDHERSEARARRRERQPERRAEAGPVQQRQRGVRGLRSQRVEPGLLALEHPAGRSVVHRQPVAGGRSPRRARRRPARA